MKKESKREFIEISDNKIMKLLKSALNIKQDKCYYCKQKIKGKFSIFNKPTRLICDSILCLIEAMEDDNKKIKVGIEKRVKR